VSAAVSAVPVAAAAAAAAAAGCGAPSCLSSLRSVRLGWRRAGGGLLS
jgi:hypothetical protein